MVIIDEMKSNLNSKLIVYLFYSLFCFFKIIHKYTFKTFLHKLQVLKIKVQGKINISC